MALTDTEVKNLKPGSKNFKKYDSKGLFLEVRTTGKKVFRFKFKYNDKYQLLTLGAYPEISLKRARELHFEARQQLAEGIDPVQSKKTVQESKKHTFETVFNEWYNTYKEKWTPGHAKTVYRRIEANILPWLKNRPIREISTREILEYLRKIEARGAVETAHRVCQIISQVFVYAVASGILENNPAADLHKALKPVQKKNLPAITEPARIKELLKAIDGANAGFVVYCALRFAPLVFVRPGELRKAEWTEIDWKNDLWIIPAPRMKKKREHLVPLSKQARGILEELYPLTGENRKNIFPASREYIFPAIRTPSRPMSEGTLNAALLRLGFTKEEHCPHGFRSMASTRLHEMGWSSRVIETQLAHVDKNQVRGVYNRAVYLEERTRMMQAWADYLDSLKNGDKVLPFQQNTA